MSSKDQNLSSIADSEQLCSGVGRRFAIVVARWNKEITGALLQGAKDTLLRSGCVASDIEVIWVPGAFELPFGSRIAIDKGSFDGVIALGCVVRGGTPHFEYVCSGATQGIMELQLRTGIPIGFGLLTVDTMQQAVDRAGGELGNKGDEAAATILEMVAINQG